MFYLRSEFRLSSWEIRIGNNDIVGTNDLFYNFDGDFPMSATMRFVCDCGEQISMCGRYITIQRIDQIPEEVNAILTICEAMVYGESVNCNVLGQHIV